MKLIQLLGKYDSAYQDFDACDHSLAAWKDKLNGVFFRFDICRHGWVPSS